MLPIKKYSSRIRVQFRAKQQTHQQNGRWKLLLGGFRFGFAWCWTLCYVCISLFVRHCYSHHHFGYVCMVSSWFLSGWIGGFLVFCHSTNRKKSCNDFSLVFLFNLKAFKVFFVCATIMPSVGDCWWLLVLGCWIIFGLDSQLANAVYGISQLWGLMTIM